MEYRIEDNILWVKGKLDSGTSPDFEEAISSLAESLVGEPPQAVLELSGIETLTSAPLRAMLTLAKRLHAKKGNVLLCAPSPIAVEALKVGGFMRLEVFQVIASLDEISPAPSQDSEAAIESEEAPLPPPAQPLKAETPQKPPAPVEPASSPAEPMPPPEEASASPGRFRRLLNGFRKR